PDSGDRRELSTRQGGAGAPPPGSRTDPRTTRAAAASPQVTAVSMQHAIDWHRMFVPSGSLVELVIRGSLMYLLILAGFRIFRRDAGSLSVSDLLVVVLIADASQNGMAGEYHSLTEGAVIVATIFAWNYLLDWLAYRSSAVAWLLH